ncbi:isocitrate lyase/PEP mutase family protein [Sinomicrobium weinanense]|uniref:Isocitrate lyase/phosphoenolpyruvate mutase family protein n=1 Tax=Sinomicrobium weinanense TaxID=2842200 RepID=A0A926Q2X8_9FLAO|nr:isocitrate lyase/phosphoenolpyruvate mutase family protein [Sinomicrobium weinanense]MBC9796299.1 isocitrate lyase/phosphoenolpyruvate mutase family protein [Sinomicrobium weinanense]MBU3123220.1 isocitrate lyase/phosphoenolpyruvate mutase family protein [Sinomicrobium weinanense]
MNKYKEFSELHHQSTPFVLGNVWDVKSAEVMEQQGFKALGTSSAAISHMLGYEDGENLPFDELFFIVKRIAAGTSVPLSVDIEGGYGESVSEIIANIEKLYHLGVAGINIEDSRVGGERKLLSAEDFSEVIGEVKNHLKQAGKDLFINVRTDTFILGIPSATEETVKRAKLYEQAGVDGLFVPCIVKEQDIRTVISGTLLPVNVMCMPELPSFESLAECGVKRISMGNFIHSGLMDIFTETIKNIRAEGSFKTLFKNAGHGKG